MTVERYTLTDAARFNIAHGQRAPVRTRDGEREMRWGLLAPWRGHGGKRAPMTYVATTDDLEAMPFLRKALKKQRCLVHADGWFAWRRLPSGKKQPYWIHAPARTAFAGIGATHDDDGVPSFAIVVRAADGIAAPIDAIMPALADERWLDTGEIATGLAGWRADAVSTYVDDPAHDDAGCIAPLGNPAQGELF